MSKAKKKVIKPRPKGRKNRTNKLSANTKVKTYKLFGTRKY